MDKIKIKSSFLIISGYEFKIAAEKQIELSSEFLMLPVDTGRETVLASLSFKHVINVELMDNSEQKGAGLALHVNNFMMGKLQQYLVVEGNKLMDYKCSYSRHKLIVLDILNCDYENMHHIRQILSNASLFHHNYVVQQMNKNKKSKLEIAVQFVGLISHNQWSVLLSMLSDTGLVVPIKYDRHSQRIPIIPVTQNDHGYMPDPRRLNNNHNNIVQQHQPTYLIQQRPPTPPHSIVLKAPTYTAQGFIIENKNVPQHLLSKKVLNDHIFNGNNHLQLIDVQQPSHSSFQHPSVYQVQQTGSQQKQSSHQHQQSDNQQPQSSYLLQDGIITTPEKPLRVHIKHQQKNKKQKPTEEIHLSDDEPEVGVKPCSSKYLNDVLFRYPQNANDSCSVHKSDLKHLALDVMLNDTIIYFYLKYIHYSLVPEDRRDRIYIFNSFLFERLTQAPAHGKTQVTLATRIKRVVFNFQAVKNWTKKVDIFSKDYVVVPINEEIHWYLAIIVNPHAGVFDMDGEAKYNPSDSSGPFLILIDPALDKHLDVRQQLSEYLHLEYADKHKKDGKYFKRESLQVIQPTLIPQQKGYIDCGLFLLHFAELFLAISNRASFRCWFHDFQIQHKRNQIQQVIRQVAPHVKPSMFIYQPTPNNNTKKTRKSKRQQPLLEAFPLIGRDRRQSESRVSEIARDPRFSVLYRPRSCDSLIAENKERPLVLQPPTILEMKRYRKIRNPLIDAII
ncbi:unnamed protein product [Meloidogyne enterolobii]|uniref:Uncharacterized protein n=1 Tax=Meloidogyne enterolobii TaxID=390850 RepID=A0ACB0Z7N7_MELEN